jgi:glutaredoxin
MASKLPILYVKTGCPWCKEVEDFLNEHGIAYREKNVSKDAESYEEMFGVSRQGKAPVLDWHGKILADFGVAELVPFLRQQNVKLEDS